MKQKITIMICALIAIMSITALSQERAFEIFEDATLPTDATFEETENSVMQLVPSVKVEEISDLGEMFVEVLDNYVKANDFEEVDQKRIKNRFITTLTEYQMNSEELSHVKKLLTEGYDMEKVLEVYEFIRWTNCDYTVIAGIYDAGIENCDDENWIYDAYDKFFDRTEDMLSVEDVAYYIANGVTVEEIVGAYELSFSGEKTTKQMLSERMNGKNWNEISASSLSNTPEAVINAPEMTIGEIMAFKNICVRHRKDFVDIADIQSDNVRVNEEVRSMERLKTIEKESLMLENNATPVTEEVTKKYKVEYADNKPQVFITEDVFEEDLITVEEPEVE